MESPLHRHTCEVAFADTDASGWMHFPNIFLYVERAEHDFLKSRGVLVFARDQGGWPRVRLTCDFHRPLVTGDRIEVLLDISHIGTTSITWEFAVLTATGETAAAGTMTTVRVNAIGKPMEIPAADRAALGR